MKPAYYSFRKISVNRTHELQRAPFSHTNACRASGIISSIVSDRLVWSVDHERLEMSSSAGWGVEDMCVLCKKTPSSRRVLYKGFFIFCRAHAGYVLVLTHWPGLDTYGSSPAYHNVIIFCGADPYDILSDKDLIIYESAKSFDLGQKSSFCTWLSNNVKYKCLHMISRSTKKQMLADKVKRNTVQSLNEQPYKNKELNRFILNELNKIRDKRIKSVYSLRYFAGEKMTWSRIGKRLGFSSQTAINLHKRGAEILKRKINK